MLNKLQVYYQPIQRHPDFHESLTISLYDFDEANDTFVQKIVREYLGAKYKIKKEMRGIDSIRAMLSTLDLSKYNSTDISSGDAYYYIKFGDHFLATSNAEDIRDILDFVQFDEIVGYSLDEYEKCN